MTDNGYTLVVCSCDAYRDLWPPFFSLLKRNWPGAEHIDILLNTETGAFACDGLNIRAPGLYREGERPSWSRRMIDCLRLVKTDFVLLMLDDFFLESTADTEKIAACAARMREDPRIVNFCFVPTLWDNISDGRFAGFERKKRVTPFRVSCQAGLWRRMELLRLLRPHETPWEFEIFGSIRSRLRRGVYYVAQQGAPRAVEYDWFAGGAVHRGKWTPRAAALLRENGFDIDISKRGIDDNPARHPSELPQDAREKHFLGRMAIRIGVLWRHRKSLF